MYSRSLARYIKEPIQKIVHNAYQKDGKFIAALIVILELL
uniref:Uncharacterized protein n=1 Tax=Arundo donax TaxID=35708 RepID=A0A0A8ZXE4_ARUDO